MELYIVRHAIAYDRDPERWPDDSVRPLTPKGERRFRRAARGLGRLAGSVDVHLSSPYLRAWRTAEVLADEAGWRTPERSDALVPGSPPGAMLDVLRDCAGATTVALVGHEPHLHELISYLLTGEHWRVQVEMRKGAAALVGVDDGIEPGRAALRRLLPPKVLRMVTGRG